METLQGRVSLVTGASSGLGAHFARILAERGSDVILVARREDRLRELADEITARDGVQAHVIPMDLSAKDAAQALYDRIQALGAPVDVLINNAGFGIYGNFIDVPWEREQEMLQLDIVTLVHLTKLFVKDMVARDFGYILQMSSVGGYQPSPTYTTYSAAKSFVLSFGEALAYELRNTKVKVSVLSPGITATEFLQVSGQKPTLYQRLALMDGHKVARIGIDAMLKGKHSKIPGLINSLPIWTLRFTPRRLSPALANFLMTYGS